MGAKSDQKSKPPLKRKNQLNISRLMFSWLSGLQVGSKNRSKMESRRPSYHDLVFASNFDRFWLPTWTPETPKIIENPTSPLGSGGLAWYICFQPSSFQPFRFQPLRGGDFPLPLPCPESPPLTCEKLTVEILKFI